MIRPGDEIEQAIWYDANTCIDPVGKYGESVKEVIESMCAKSNVVHTGISYKVLKPGDDRVPTVPRWLEKIPGAVPRLLIATTQAKVRIITQSGISNDLDKKDLEKLRAITRRKYKEFNPLEKELTDQECDRFIDTLGMEVVLDQLRSSSVH